MHYLYRITCLKNNKIYIGQTNDSALRWSQHKSAAKHQQNDMVITRALIKHKVENFIFEIICSSKNLEDINFTETQVIEQYQSRNPEIGYNVDYGGGALTRSPEVIEKISAGLLEHYKTNSNWNKGGTLTEEWKQNISEASMGKAGTNTGKTFDDEWRIKISKSHVGIPNLSNRKFTEEIEQKICRLYVEENKSTHLLGPMFDCAKTTITDILKRNNIPIRHSNRDNGRNIFTKEQELEICNIYLLGKVSRSELSRLYNCGKTTIRDILLRNGVKL